MVRLGRALLLALLVGLASPASAFSLYVSLSAQTKGTMELILFSPDRGTTVLRCKANDGTYAFEGSVAKPTYAELRHSAVDEPLALIVEEAEIKVYFNMSKPSMSPVMGSRANSMFRYRQEQWQGNMDSVLAYVRTHGQGPEIPYLAESYLLPLAGHNDEEGFGLQQLHALVDSLRAPAKLTWHYQHLGAALRRMDSLTVGHYLPAFEYVDQRGAKVRYGHFERWTYRIVLVGATWCSQCDAAQQLLADRMPDKTVLRIDLDRHPDGWDASFLNDLAIDYIPYIILLDDKGRILARDLRAWEVVKYYSE